MLNAIINLNSYEILNGAIALSYIMSRIILSLPFLKKTLQTQRLKFARFSLITVVIAFLVAPYIATIIPSPYQSSFQFGPFLKNASTEFLHTYKMSNENITQVNSVNINFSFNIILAVFLIMGFSFYLMKFIKNLVTLKKLLKNAFCRKKINNLQIIFSPILEIPCCWSFFKTYYIAIPNTFIENNDDVKLAIRHELQHIRQGDLVWLHVLTLIHSVCFWNPFMKLWMNWLSELQEFSCDETLVLRKKTSPAAYAQCLVNTAAKTVNKSQPNGVLGMHSQSKSILYRRVHMLFNYNKEKSRKISILFAYLICFFTAVSSAYAFNGSSKLATISSMDEAMIINHSHLDSDFEILARPEVVSEINNIRASEQKRSFSIG